MAPQQRTKNDDTVISEVPPVPAKETVLEKHQEAAKESISRDDSYVAPPLVSSNKILGAGAFLFGLAVVWPPLILVVAFFLSQLIPYCFRVTDEPTKRRMILRQFEKDDKEHAERRIIPDDVDFEDRYWTNSRGFLLYTSILKPKNKPIKAVICHCHGYSDNPSYSRRKEMLRFVEEGIALVMIDYEGHGRSDGTLGLVMNWDELVNDVSTFFKETVDSQFSDRKIFLMGESMGGAVAFCVYKQMPELYAGVNFICPMAKIADDMLPAQWVIDTVRKVAGPKGEASIFGFLPIAPAKGDLKEFSFRLASKRALLTRIPTVFGRKPRIATARELIDATTRISSSLSEFDAPFLVQHGKADRVTDPQLSQMLYDEAKSEDKTIRLYDGMWHTLIGGEPDENVELVLDDSIKWILERV